jgi:hypothetical protein
MISLGEQQGEISIHSLSWKLEFYGNISIHSLSWKLGFYENIRICVFDGIGPSLGAGGGGG